MSWTSGLNPEQAKAVLHNEGPLLILAGAGSGKTTVLVARTGRMIAEKVADAKQICVLTFTNKAARELKHRVAAKVGPSAKKIWAGTFHSFGLHLLRKYPKQARLPKNFGIIDQSDSSAIIKELLKDIKVAGKDRFDTDRLLNLINDLRVNPEKLKNQDRATDEYDEVAEVLMPKFVRKLELLGVVDFEDLLLKPLQMFRDHPDILQDVQDSFTQVMVDEFQDTNVVQMDLIHQLVKRHQNITVVGDDDQSIYGWRGACVSNILDFPHQYRNCEVIRLERNYRSTSAILSVANEVIKKNKKRHGKVLRSEGAKAIEEQEVPEIFVMENEDDEAEFVVRELQQFQTAGFQPKQMAVLYRSNSQGGLLEAFLRRAQIPYAVSGGSSFFDRKEIKDILAYLRCSLAPHDVAFRRIINTPSRGIGDVTIEKIIHLSETEKISFYQAAKKILEPQHLQDEHVTESAVQGLRSLFDFLDNFADVIVRGKDTAANELLKSLTDMGYRQLVYGSTQDPNSAEKKWQLIEIFARVLDSNLNKSGRALSSLREFVDLMELRDDMMGDEKEKNEVQLMTLHACKGLEFPVCFMIGMEEDILPHKTLGLDIDEERRLFYVGVTRAQKRLILTRCLKRKRHGVLRPSSPSRFLLEIPSEMVKIYEQGARPVSGEARDSLVANFLAGLDKKIASSPPK